MNYLVVESFVWWDEWRACLIFTTWHTCNVTTVHSNTKNYELPGSWGFCVVRWVACVFNIHNNVIHVMLQLCSQIQQMLNYLVLHWEFCVWRWIEPVFNIHNITYMYCYNSTLNYKNCWTTLYCTERSVCWDEWRACLLFTTWHTCNVTTVHLNTKNGELPGNWEFCVVRWVAHVFNIHNMTYM